MKRFLWIILLLPGLNSYSQKREVNFAIGGGPSYFFNDNTLNRRIGSLKKIGVNVLFNKKNRRIIFNPGISLYYNNYNSNLSYSGYVYVRQSAVGLDLDMLMKVSKKSYLRVGIILSGLHYTSIGVMYNQYSGGIYGYSNNEVYNGYSSANYQAGVAIGMAVPFLLFKKQMKFDFGIYQAAAGLVERDFYFNDNLSGERVKVIGTKSLPTRLVIALEINLAGLKKPKTEDGKEM